MTIKNEIHFHPTGYSKLDKTLEVFYGDAKKVRKLIGEDVLEENFDDILTDVHTTLWKKDSGLNWSDINPFDISISQWKKNYGDLNTQHHRFNFSKPEIWGDPPKVVGETFSLGGTFKVEMEGVNPRIIANYRLHYSIEYTILIERRGPHPFRKSIKEHEFYTEFKHEINLRNSDDFNRLYLRWLEGKFY